MDKATLRTMYLKRRKMLDDRMHQMFEMMLVSRLEDYLKNMKVKKIGMYYPMQKEINLLSLKETYDTYLPKIENGQIVYYQDRGKYEKAAFNITVPSHNASIDANDLDVIIVPGIVFDKERYRIGYGKGYYDTLLSMYKGHTIGVCFDLFVLSDIPKEAHDKQVDVLITDQRLLKRM